LTIERSQQMQQMRRGGPSVRIKTEQNSKR
jgi:hypothetical protein